MLVVTVVSSVLLAAVLAASFARKVSGARTSRELRDRLRIAPAAWQAIGVLELLAAAGLLAGIVLAPLGVAAAVGSALLMAGAVAVQLARRLVGSRLVSPAVLLLLSVAAAASRLASA